jgi:hypothetical protein
MVYIKKCSEIGKLRLNKFPEFILGKIVNKKELIYNLTLVQKKLLFLKITISDLSGTIDIFLYKIMNIQIGDLVEITNIRHFCYRNSLKIFGSLSRIINLKSFNKKFKINLEKNYSRKKFINFIK